MSIKILIYCKLKHLTIYALQSEYRRFTNCFPLDECLSCWIAGAPTSRYIWRRTCSTHCIVLPVLPASGAAVTDFSLRAQMRDGRTDGENWCGNLCERGHRLHWGVGWLGMKCIGNEQVSLKRETFANCYHLWKHLS